MKIYENITISTVGLVCTIFKHIHFTFERLQFESLQETLSLVVFFRSFPLTITK